VRNNSTNPRRFWSLLLLSLLCPTLLLACGDPTATIVPATSSLSTTSATTTTVPPTTGIAAPTTTTVATSTVVPATATPIPTTTAASSISTNLTDGCVTNYDPNTDYFPQKATLKYANGFKVEYFKNYKVITVLTPWRDAKETFQYVLVQCGTPAPKGFDKALSLNVPSKSLISMSTTYLPYLDNLGLLDKLVGVDSAQYVSNPTVKKLVADKKVAEVGNGAKVNVEKVLDLKPDLIMTYGLGDPQNDAHPKLLEAGLKVVLNGDYMDSTPLGRAEWGKFLALFFNREGQAQKQFDEVATRYETLASKARVATPKPTVLANAAYKGTWYMPGGNSYSGKTLVDAGGAYYWADDKSSGSLPLTFEAVFDKASQADIWLYQDYAGSLEDIKAADERYSSFAAFKNNKIYNNDLKVNENGGNDIYESGVANPDVVLADLVKIFHPELAADHQFVYYRLLAPKK